jgi:hypothetical protein
MHSVFVLVSASHLRRSLATNSGPLSDRRCSDTPFHTMTSANAPITLAFDQHRSARISRHSRVDSSTRYHSICTGSEKLGSYERFTSTFIWLEPECVVFHNLFEKERVYTRSKCGSAKPE